MGHYTVLLYHFTSSTLTHSLSLNTQTLSREALAPSLKLMQIQSTKANGLQQKRAELIDVLIPTEGRF